MALSESSSALRSCADRMWMRHRAAIAEQAGCADDDPKCAALAHFALQTRALAPGPRSGEIVAAAFDLLENGWQGRMTSLSIVESERRQVLRCVVGRSAAVSVSTDEHGLRAAIQPLLFGS
ncbi:hypothetical protein ACH347_09855 [Saccharopolyspora sp. 5N102]|uniref:hypothetical protein n=1 Tax=Saccharopolyspora sp. 5N102 TaxID=3375155 RepID=UPI0037B651E9